MSLASFITEQNRASALREFARQKYGDNSPEAALAAGDPAMFSKVLAEQALPKQYTPQSAIGKLLADQQAMGFIPQGGQGGTAPAGNDPFSLALSEEMEPSAAQKEEEKKNSSKMQLDSLLGEVSSLYDELGAKGGTVESDGNPIMNIGRYLANTEPFTVFDTPILPGGQTIGRALGTEEQSIRNKINAKLPLLKTAIKNATGMSAQEMNSNVELQQMMKAVTSLTNDRQSNKAIVKNLSELYGLGGLSTVNPNSEAGVPAAPPAQQSSPLQQYGSRVAQPVVLTRDPPPRAPAMPMAEDAIDVSSQGQDPRAGQKAEQRKAALAAELKRRGLVK